MIVATCSRGTEEVLAEELVELGIPEVGVTSGAVRFGGGLGSAYRACLWSRIASRVIWPVGGFTAHDAEGLYEGVRGLPWSEHLHPDRTIAVRCVGRHAAFPSLRFAALKTKDAIVDRLRDEHGRRPGVDAASPDVRVHVHFRDEAVEVGIDLSGDALHRRGYRPPEAAAPLKETLAAAILRLSGWPTRYGQGAPLVDPLCGSGTLLVEAALVARDVAPGLARERWGFTGWLGHAPSLFESLLSEARVRRDSGAQNRIALIGFDRDRSALASAQRSAQEAGVLDAIELSCCELERAAAPEGGPGVVVTNPPYGERLGDVAALPALYETLGDVLRRRFVGWHAYVLAGNPELARHIGLRARRRHVLYNGPIECRLLDYPIADRPVQGAEGPAWRGRTRDAPMFENRLRKNLRRLGRWAEREGISCYRLYDAEIPEYNVAVDRYGDAVHVLEYERPPKVDPARADAHLRDVRSVVQDVLKAAPERVFVKVHRRQRGRSQYGRMGEGGPISVVEEGGLSFEVNLGDYLDTGLFPDQRRVRAFIRERATGARFLNLFAYTGAATVYAAAGGARATTSVDLSNTYLEWARRNLALNGRWDAARHRLVRADVLRWLRHERALFDLVYVAPPVYSRSKAMEGDFDVRRDHVSLLHEAGKRVAPSGMLLFSTHAKGFELDPQALSGFEVEDLSRALRPPDFARSPFVVLRAVRSR